MNCGTTRRLEGSLIVMTDSHLLFRSQDHRKSRHPRPASMALLADECGQWLKTNGDVSKVVSLSASWTLLQLKHFNLKHCDSSAKHSLKYGVNACRLGIKMRFTSIVCDLTVAARHHLGFPMWRALKLTLRHAKTL